MATGAGGKTATKAGRAPDGRFGRGADTARAAVAVDKAALEQAGKQEVKIVGGGDETLTVDPNDYYHIPGYKGHKPSGWAPHRGRKNFGVHPEGADSKGESHITNFGRPPMPSGAGFEGNTRLKEGPPTLNKDGLFKAGVEDEIEGISKKQMQAVGDTGFASLKADRREQTLGRCADSVVDGSPKKLDKTLNKNPDGYASGNAQYKGTALFQGTYPSSRHIPGYTGHVPGGTRI